ncbi:hypothetical protein ACHQM5_005765 [Ranunculus cassubicifolius]
MTFGTRNLMGPLLAINFVIFLIVIGLASWSLDKYIDGEQHHPHLGGNPATSFMLVFALLGSVLGACSVLSGFMHLRAWRNDTLASAAPASLIPYAIMALAFGVAIKEIVMGGHRGRRLQTLEAFVIISTLTQLMYLLLLHSGTYNRNYGPGYRNTGPSAEYETAGMEHDIPKTSTPPTDVV